MNDLDQEVKTLCDWIYQKEGTLCNSNLPELVKESLLNQRHKAIKEAVQYLQNFVNPKVVMYHDGDVYSFGLILEHMQKALENN